MFDLRLQTQTANAFVEGGGDETERKHDREEKKQPAAEAFMTKKNKMFKHLDPTTSTTHLVKPTIFTQAHCAARGVVRHWVCSVVS